MTLGIIQERPGLGSLLGAGLGQGLQQGIATGSDFMMKLGLERAKQQQQMNLLNEIFNPQNNNLESPSSDGFLSNAGQYKKLASLYGQDAEGLPTGGEMPQDLQNKLMQSLQTRKPAGTPNQQQFSYSNLSPTQKAKIAIVNPQVSRAMAEQEKTDLKREEFEWKKRAGEREVFTDVKGFWNSLGEEREKIPALESSLEAQMDAVLKGDVDPWSSGHIAEIARTLGAPTSITAPLETPGSKEFKTARKTYLATTLREAFRGNTTQTEIDLAESLLSQAGATREGNLASIWLLQSKVMLEKERIRMASELRKKGVSGYEIPDIVFDQLQPYRKMLSDQYIEAVKEISKKKK